MNSSLRILARGTLNRTRNSRAANRWRYVHAATAAVLAACLWAGAVCLLYAEAPASQIESAAERVLRSVPYVYAPGMTE